ncbi:MAG TPA: hypothetical protein DCQ64_20110 [Candidatus Rokubacteria bacterium]|nr:hypothetical protein [Candidatus Rokubacteria bacterium]
MGGKGSGGRRVGAGRKRKDNVLAFTQGSRQRTGAGAALPVAEAVEPPKTLSAAERLVWDELAPRAVALLTLTPSTKWSFVDLVRARVNRDDCHLQIATDGWVITVLGEKKKHPLEPALRGWEQRVEAGMARFSLAPMGKAVAAPAKPEDPFAEFEVGT